MDAKDIGRRCAAVLRRIPPEVTVVAATKGRSADEVRAAIAAGIQHVGENYVQEAEVKRPHVPEAASWHMIGHLQRNKAARALQLFDWLQTLDSLRLARRLDRLLLEAGRTLPVLVQVNVGREPQKAGLSPEQVPQFIGQLADMPRLRVRGLMAIPPAPQRPEDVRPHFRTLRALFSQLRRADIPGAPLDVLSMGMSQDWEIAVEEGATMVRLGTALFGPRT
ncbi:MAG: YggS family pyridoxal phosphate-dependent enzyme [Candidatus Bipolaricaulaceae bacterium]